MDRCKECIVYDMLHNHINAEKCPCCGEMTYYWKQDENGKIYTECSNCSAMSAMSMATPCDMDPDFSKTVRIKVEPQSDNLNNHTVLNMAKYFQISAMKMREKLINGYYFIPSSNQFTENVDFLRRQNIIFQIIKPENPRKNYSYYKYCHYKWSTEVAKAFDSSEELLM